MLSEIYDSLLTIAYPQACQICANSVEKISQGMACGHCWQTTQFFFGDETLCAKCGRFLQSKPFELQTFCHRCDDHFYDQARAVGVYEKALAASILNLKREPFLAEKLQKLLFSRFQSFDFQDSILIIPVPLSKKRLHERGFNQAAVLARILSKKSNFPLDEYSLARTVDTLMHRVAMDDKARRASVKNVFDVTRPNFIKNKNILLIDDVFTSGATVSNCAEILKKNGADKVYVLTVARTV